MSGVEVVASPKAFITGQRLGMILNHLPLLCIIIPNKLGNLLVWSNPGGEQLGYIDLGAEIYYGNDGVEIGVNGLIAQESTHAG